MKSRDWALTVAAVMNGVFWAGCASVDDPPVLSCEDPVRTCAEVGAEFGTILAPCGEIECGRLRFARSPIGDPYSVSNDPGLVATPQGLVLAFLNNRNLSLVREQADGSWSTELVDDVATGFNPQGLAVDAQGRVWIAYLTESGIQVGTSEAGAPFQFLAGPTGASHAPALAVDLAGVAHLVFRDAEFSAATNRFSILTIQHAMVSAAGVLEEVVERLDTLGEQGPALGLPSVLLDGSGAVHVLYVWRKGEGLLRHAQKTGAEAFTVEEVGAAGGLYNAGQLSAAFDGEGRLHVLYPDSPYNLHHAVAQPTGWEVSTVSSSNSNRENALAVDEEGTVHVAFHTSSSLRYGIGRRGVWPAQEISACDEGGVRMVFDQDGDLRIAQLCEGLSVLEISGAYPDDYLATCATVTEGICAASCSCAGAGSCRTVTGSGSFGVSSAASCAMNINSRICGDATRDPAPLYACASNLGPFQCGTGDSGQTGALLKDTVCGTLFLD